MCGNGVYGMPFSKVLKKKKCTNGSIVGLHFLLGYCTTSVEIVGSGIS